MDTRAPAKAVPSGSGPEDARFHQALFLALPDAVVCASFPDRLVVDVNPAFVRLLGHPRSALVGQSTERLHVDRKASGRFLELVEPFLSRGESVTVETPLRRADGVVLPCRVTVTPLERCDGAPIGVVGIVRLAAHDVAAPSEEALRDHVLDSMVEGVCLTDEAGRIVYTNPAEDAMFGYERGELAGQHVEVLHAYPPEHNRRIAGEVIARLREVGAWEGEFENRRKDGGLFTTRARISRVDIGGRPHWVCVQEDVTERKRVEREALAHTRSLKTLVRVQEELARSLDLDSVVQRATDAATLLTGAAFGAFFYTKTDAQGERFTLYALSGASREAFARFPMPRNTKVFGPTFAGERVVRSDDITKDPRYGQNAPYHGMPEGHLSVRSYLAVPVVSRDGSTVHGGLFFGHPEPGRFLQDSEDVASAIAAQAATALENANLYQQARQSEEKWRRLVENAPVQIVTIDADGKILTLNRSVTGDDPARLVGMRLHDLLPAEDRERLRGIMESAIRDQEPEEYEVRIVSPSGEERWFHSRIAPLAQGAVIISSDITQRKRDENEIALVRAQLIQGEKLAALGSLVSGVAHELRTPLTFLANNSFLLKQRISRVAAREGSAQEALAEASPYLAEITAGVDRINQLVEDLRRYTKARKESTFAVDALHLMTADAVELFRAANRATHPIETSLSPTPPTRANKGAIQQLVLNLLMNAAEASAEGSPVRIVTRAEGDQAVLEVIDRGGGIAPEMLPRIYDPLFTTKAEGTGLGLSIVQRIVEEHHAKIECESAPGEGTRFRVTFPPV